MFVPFKIKQQSSKKCKRILLRHVQTLQHQFWWMLAMFTGSIGFKSHRKLPILILKIRFDVIDSSIFISKKRIESKKKLKMFVGSSIDVTYHWTVWFKRLKFQRKGVGSRTNNDQTTIINKTHHRTDNIEIHDYLQYHSNGWFDTVKCHYTGLAFAVQRSL